MREMIQLWRYVAYIHSTSVRFRFGIPTLVAGLGMLAMFLAVITEVPSLWPALVIPVALTLMGLIYMYKGFRTGE